MKTFFAFFKKELTENLRTGRVTILAIIFVLFGIMNPAIAKLTPWMMELLSDTLAENGMVITEIKVDALTSWTQFYKNIPTALIVFVLITCSTLTGECQKGTLIPVLTKGLSRAKVLCVKLVTQVLLWTGCYWICYGVTYTYNVYFWDNSIVRSSASASFAYFLFGLWVVTLIILCSSFSPSNTGVLLGTGGAYVAAYLLSLIPSLHRYTPIQLTESMPLLTGASEPESLMWAVAITALLSVLNVVIAVFIFNKRKL